ncbi:MAG: hypothetical protein ACREE3_17280 [Stellaceae bacterium]
MTLNRSAVRRDTDDTEAEIEALEHERDVIEVRIGAAYAESSDAGDELFSSSHERRDAIDRELAWLRVDLEEDGALL